MATIPSGQKFHTIAADVDTMNRGSASANADRSIFTMADIVESIPAHGLSGSGTVDTMSMWSDSSTLTDSSITQDTNGIIIPKRISHLGDLDTFLEFQNDKVIIRANNKLCFEGSSNTALYGNGSLMLLCTSSGVQVYQGSLRTPQLHVTGTDAPSGTAKGPLNVVFGAAPTASSFGTVGDIIVDPLAINVCTVTGADPTPATWLKTDLSATGGLSGSGTTGKVSRFTASETIADSLIGDDGTTVSLGTDITIGDSIKFSEDSTSKFGFVAGQDNFFIYNENSLQFECNATTTTLYHSGVYKLYTTADGVKVDGQVNLQALNTAPAANDSAGTLGEIRWTEGFVYICTLTGADGAANWNRATLTSGW